MTMLLVGTDHDLVVCSRSSDGYRPAWSALGGHYVSRVVAREGVILAGTRDGIHRSDVADRHGGPQIRV